MKAKVKETGEIIDVQMLYPYSRLDCNGKIIGEYDKDELEFIIPSKPKMIPLDKACEWLENNADTYIGVEGYAMLQDEFFEDFRKEMED